MTYRHIITRFLILLGGLFILMTETGEAVAADLGDPTAQRELDVFALHRGETSP